MRYFKILSVLVLIAASLFSVEVMAADIPNIGGGTDGKAKAEQTATYVIGFLTFVGIILGAIFGTVGAIKVSQDDESGWRTIKSAGIGAVLSIIIGGLVIGMIS